MTNRTQQFIGTAVFGAAVITASTMVIPQILSAQPTPTVAVVPTTAESTVVEVAPSSDSSVDMNHWQETVKEPSKYKPGKPRKGK